MCSILRFENLKIKMEVSYPLPLNTLKSKIDPKSNKKKAEKPQKMFSLIDTMVVEDVHYVVYATSKLLKLMPVKHGEMYFEIDEEQNELTIDLEQTEPLLQIAAKGNLIVICYQSSIDVYELENAFDEDVNMSDDCNSAVCKQCPHLTLKRHFKNKTALFRKVIFISNSEFFAIDNKSLKLFNINRKKATIEIDVRLLEPIDFEVISAQEVLILSSQALYRLKIMEDDSVSNETIARYNNLVGFFLKVMLSKHSSTIAYLVAKKAVLAVKTDEIRNRGNKSHISTMVYTTGIMKANFSTCEKSGNSEYLLVSSAVKSEPTLLFVFDFETKKFQVEVKINTLSDHFYNAILLSGKCLDFRSDMKSRFRMPNCGVKIVVSKKVGLKTSICLLIVNSIGDVTHQYLSKNTRDLLYDRKFSIQEYAKWDEAIIKKRRSRIELDRIDGRNNVHLLRTILKTKLKS